MPSESSPLILFAGPSLFGLPEGTLRSRSLRILPPARRGDIDAVTARVNRPGVIVLADGRFHSQLAVGHAELRRALAEKWTVWGVSSMGAIRACEMRGLGMRGFGQVYERFSRDSEFSDDEVALLHEDIYPYRPVSEPLIHMRLLLDRYVRNGDMAVTDAEWIASWLKTRWFGFRTLALLRQLISRRCNLSDAHCTRLVGQIAFCRAKNDDLRALLHEGYLQLHLSQFDAG